MSTFTESRPVELILENAQMAISGVWQISDDGTINTDTINLVPGSVIPVAPNSDGLQPLKHGGNFNVADLILQDMDCLYHMFLGRPPNVLLLFYDEKQLGPMKIQKLCRLEPKQNQFLEKYRCYS